MLDASGFMLYSVPTSSMY